MIIALLIISALLVTFLLTILPAPEKYVNIYLFDGNKKGVDYAEVLVANKNSTFNIFVEVENHMRRILDNTQVQLKVTNDLEPTFPLDGNAIQTFTGSVQDGSTWESNAIVSINQPGNYLVVFELWIPGENSTTLGFSGVYTALNVQVIAG